MTSKQIKFLLFILILVAIVTDIFIRLFYASNLHLTFNSREFNNIASPIISILGFLGVIVTILLTLNQLKQNQATNYFNYYKEYIDKIGNETPQNDSNLAFSTSELLKFNLFVMDKYEQLEMNHEYINDLARFKTGVHVISEGKSYDLLLGNIRLFGASLSILLRRYYMLINEIEQNKLLDQTHKEILFKHLYESQLGDYTSGCWLVGFENELKLIKENLYTGFVPKMKEELKFYNSNFYELFHLVENNKILNELKNGSYK